MYARCSTRLSAALVVWFVGMGGLDAGRIDEGVECLDPGDYYAAADTADVFDFGPVRVWGAQDDGISYPLAVLDCHEDRGLELFIRLSPARADVPARFSFRSVCGPGIQPQRVVIRFSQGGDEAVWRATRADGSLLAQAVSGPSAGLQEVSLSHPEGIFFVEVTGAEICVDAICYDCRDPRPEPGDEPCADPNDYFDAEGEFEKVEIGLVTVTAATLPSGDVAPLRIVDCDGDQELELFVPWSEAGASPPAQISLERVDCANDTLYPTTVIISVASCGFNTWFRAYDVNGNYLTTGFVANGATNVDVVLAHASGIFRVDIIGAELCIDRICWRCDELPPEPTEPCADPNDYFGAEGEFEKVELGLVTVSAATLPSGDVAPLRIVDCDGDQELELFVPWSEAGASPPAQISLERVDCANDTLYPTTVIISVASCGFNTWFRAYDVNGNYLTTGFVANGATNVDVVLAHASGIFRVDIIGAELCIDRICWRCDELEVRPRDCVRPSDGYDEPGLVDEVILPPIRITPPTSPDGVEHPLELTDCDQDGALDVFIAESFSGDQPPAQIYFPIGCSPDQPHPGTVLVTFRSAQVSRWVARAADGTGLLSVVMPGAAASQTVVLSHPSGIYRVEIHGSGVCISEVCWDCEAREIAAPTFRRADSSGDLTIDLSDGLLTLNFLFLGGRRPGCDDAADADDDGAVALNDAMYTFNFLFLGGPAPLGSDGCYPDSTEDRLGCASPPRCAE